MKEIPISNCERSFIREAVSLSKRIDGRHPYDYRDIRITYGIDLGNCQVELGHSRIMTQVSCEVVTPKPGRPTEGALYTNIQLTMVAAQIDQARLNEIETELNGLMERSIRGSNCIDMESLCILAAKKVWSIRVDIHVLNHDGNLATCASIAAMASLSHFRRPDVTVIGEEVTIHSVKEKSVPLSMHHMPICITFIFFVDEEIKKMSVLLDPLEREERVMDGKLVIAMNTHQEVCTVHMSGSILLPQDPMLKCINLAGQKVTEFTSLIHQAIKNDNLARTEGKPFGFAESICIRSILGKKKDIFSVFPNDKIATVTNTKNEDLPLQWDCFVKQIGPGTAQIGHGGPSQWDISDSDEMEEDVQKKVEALPTSVPFSKSKHKEPSDGENSEEETIVNLQSEEIDLNKESPERDLIEDDINLTVALKKKQSKTKSPKTKKKSKLKK